MKTYDRYSAAVIRSKRWKSVRYLVKRRDGFKCVKCGAVGRLEVDHIIPVRDAPEKSYDLDNLQTLCTPCHSRKTRLEIGLGKDDPEKIAWRDAVTALYRK